MFDSEDSSSDGEEVAPSSISNDNEEMKEMMKKYQQREYQTFLFDEAIKQNIIICLPTGSGKTFIAVKLVQHYLNQAIMDGKKIVFVATTVPLVCQQGKYLKRHLGYSSSSTSNNVVGIVTGDLRPEDWDGGKWKQILAKHTVFAMTDQILRQAVERAHIKWEGVSLLILDECHNATKNHPMATLMGFYKEAYKQGKIIGETLPRVLGLSATIIIGNSDKLKIIQEIKEIQERLMCKAITYHDYGEVIKCSTSADVKISLYKEAIWLGTDEEYKVDLQEILNETIEKLRMMEPDLVEKVRISSTLPGVVQNSYNKNKLFIKTESPIKKYIRDLMDIKEVFEDMGPYCARNCILLKRAYFKYLRNKLKMKNKKSTNKDTGETIVLNFMDQQLSFMDRQFDAVLFYCSPDEAGEGDNALQFISPKIRALVEILKSHRPVDDTTQSDLCGIVFCQKRITAQMICYYIQDLATYMPEEFGFLKCSFMLGTSGTNNGPAQTIALRLQTEVLDKFHQKSLNILISTKVLEEGLDVPSCNFILRYDAILTYPSFIQSMGRARQKGAQFYALVEQKENNKEKSKINQYKTFRASLTENLIKNIGIELTDQFYDPESLEDSELNTLVPPFKPSSGPQMITAGSAIQIVYSYCEQLTNDKLSTLSPLAWWSDDEGKFKVHVRLPPGSCVKYVEGKSYLNKTVAKKAAFLEVCKKLYNAGVLHKETLLPIPRHIPSHLNFFFDILESCSFQQSQDGKKVGSKNKVQWYPKKTPVEFTKQMISLENLIFYAIKIQLTRDSYFSTEEIKPLFEFENQEYCFGICAAADLSKVPDFLLFSRDGNFRVHLEKVTLPVTENVFEKIKVFTRLAFSKDSELLKLAHSILEDFDKDNRYICPLRKINNKLELAMDVMEKLKLGENIKYSKEIPMADRRIMSIDKEALNKAVVIPYYSQQKYCVLSVQTDKSPLSPFEDEKKALNYVQYYEGKNINIVKKDQPMLKTKAISPRLNFLLGDYNKSMMSRDERRNAKYAQSVVSLVPELIRQHPLPGSLFIQLKMLPSCLHRINRLLLANEIGQSVSEFCNTRPKIVTLDKRLETELDSLNKEFKDTAIRFLNHTDEMVPSVEIIEPISGLSLSNAETVGPHQINMFKVKRKLIWAEIEYIHPKNIQPSDLRQAYSSDEDQDMGILLPDSPPPDKIELIQSIYCPNEKFDQANEPELPLVTTIMEAMTLANGRDRISLEKLEMIGDSVLKLIVTLHIYHHFPEFNEGQLTLLRSKLISNRHLFFIGEKKLLGEYLAGSLFEPEHAWLPPGSRVPERLEKIAVEHGINYSVYSPIKESGAIPVHSLQDEEISAIIRDRIKNNGNELHEMGPMHTSYTHSRIGNKSVADCVEALIGAYYLSGGLAGALKFMEWMGLRGPTNEDPSNEIPYCSINELPSVLISNPRHQQNLIPLAFINQLEKLLDYEFTNHWLVVEAFTHPSYVKNNSTNGYQRLEFLGDAILDFLVTNHIYKNQKNVKNITPGLLTDLRSALVNNVTFGSQSVRYGFQKLLLHFSSQLQKAIHVFVNGQEQNGHQATGTFTYITDDDCPSKVMAEDIEVPKALGDIFESLAGAVFVDSGMSLDTVWRVFYRLMKQEIDIFSDKIPKQPIRILYEKYPGGVKFNVNETSGRYIARVKIVPRRKFDGCGTTKKSAKMAAAKFAIRTLEREERKREVFKLKDLA